MDHAWARYGCPECATTLDWGFGNTLSCSKCWALYTEDHLERLPLSAFHAWRLGHVPSGQVLQNLTCSKCSTRIPYPTCSDALHAGWLPWYRSADNIEWTCALCNDCPASVCRRCFKHAASGATPAMLLSAGWRWVASVKGDLCKSCYTKHKIGSKTCPACAIPMAYHSHLDYFSCTRCGRTDEGFTFGKKPDAPLPDEPAPARVIADPEVMDAVIDALRES